MTKISTNVTMLFKHFAIRYFYGMTAFVSSTNLRRGLFLHRVKI